MYILHIYSHLATSIKVLRHSLDLTLFMDPDVREIVVDQMLKKDPRLKRRL